MSRPRTFLSKKCPNYCKTYCQRSIRPETAKLSQVAHVFGDGTKSIRTDNPAPGISHRIDFIPPEQHQRRYSPKGKASGWIEDRLGNLKRKTPSTSHYYCWQQGEQRGKCYIPVRKMAQVQQMLSARRSVEDILCVLKPTPPQL